MTAALVRPANRSPVTPANANLVVHADAIEEAGRADETERVLREALIIAPDRPEAYRALAIRQAKDGRELESFATCATLLGRTGLHDGESLRLCAELLLYFHIRHAMLVTRQTEPTRLDFRAIGVPDVAPMALATEFLPRARGLAMAAVRALPHDAIAHVTLAECELRAGYASSARRSAERAVACASTPATLFTRALATFADHRESSAFDQLSAPILTESAPALGVGHRLSCRIDQSPETSGGTSDRGRETWSIPYRVRVGEKSFNRAVAVRTGPASARVIPGGRVVGGLFFALDPNDRAFIHGVVDEPDVAFAMPRSHDFPAFLAKQRNVVLWSGADRRLALQTPTAERHRGGRAFLLATNFSENFYHWVLDALGRLSAMPAVLNDPDVRFVVPTPLAPFQVETLAWFGITLDRVVQVAQDEIIGFDELIVVHHRKDGGCSDRGVIRWLCDHLTIPTLTPSEPPTRRLFLRRSGSSTMRRLLNEADAEALCTEFGFESVDTGRMSVSEQRDLFAQASHVVAAVGASLTNLLFVPSGARTVLMGQRGYIVPCYNALADALGHTVCYVLGTESPSGFVYPHWDFTVDLQELRAALDEQND
mgnify:CR=1 FL=1